MFGAPPQPTTIKEALQQRLDKARDTKKENWSISCFLVVIV
jgi:hypothetical protein